MVHGSIGNTFLGGSNVYGLGFSGTHTFGVGPCVGYIILYGAWWQHIIEIQWIEKHTA